MVAGVDPEFQADRVEHVPAPTRTAPHATAISRERVRDDPQRCARWRLARSSQSQASKRVRNPRERARARLFRARERPLCASRVSFCAPALKGRQLLTFLVAARCAQRASVRVHEGGLGGGRSLERVGNEGVSGDVVIGIGTVEKRTAPV